MTQTATRRRMFVSVSVGDLRCLLPTEAVSEVHPIVEITDLPGAPEPIEGVVDARGQVIGVVALRRCLRRAERPVDPNDLLVVVQTSTRPLALHVDAGADLLEIDEGDIDALHQSATAELIGAARLSDGVIVLLDVERLLTAAAGGQLDDALNRLLEESHQ